MRDSDSIGIFDSGLGGLTVARAVCERFASRSVVYLGDTARVPYGTRSPATVQRYAEGCASLLVKEGVKVLVVACNTVSAVALSSLRERLDVPVVGVIEPGARAALEISERGRIGVLATRGTIASDAYSKVISKLEPSAAVFSYPAPLLVPLAEEGWLDGEVTERVIAHYLESFEKDDIDTLLLGCTHYPLLQDVIGKMAHRVLKTQVHVVDSARATACALDELLPSSQQSPVPLRLLVSDQPDHFQRVARRFLGSALAGVSIELVDVI